jgi:hypothetical protein
MLLPNRIEILRLERVIAIKEHVNCRLYSYKLAAGRFKWFSIRAAVLPFHCWILSHFCAIIERKALPPEKKAAERDLERG